MPGFDKETTKSALMDIVRSSGSSGVWPKDLIDTLVRDGHDSSVVRSVLWELRPCSGDVIRLTNDRRLVSL